MRRPVRRRRTFETLEARRVLAVDLGQIAGVIQTDLDGDGVGDQLVAASDVSVELLRDDGDGVFDPVSGGGGDAVEQTVATDAAGAYTFDGVTQGAYFVRITPTAGLQLAPGDDGVSALISVTADDADGSTNLTFDEFDATQTVTATNPGTPTQGGTVDSGSILGGEQDLFVEVTAGNGDVEAESGFDNGSSTVLQLSSDPGVNGRLIATWDGEDNDATNVNNSLLTLNLSDSGNNSGFLLNIATDQVDGLLKIRAYSGAGNYSEATIDLSDLDGDGGGDANPSDDQVDTDGTIDGDAAEAVFVEFGRFTTDVGTGANFANVSAVQVELDFTGPGDNGLDAEIDVVGIVGVTTLTQDFLVEPELTLGDQVWIDINNNGVFDPGEPVAQGVAMELFRDNGATPGVFDATDTLVPGGTATTDASGRYQFAGLNPDDYVVRVAPSNFNPGGALEGLATSTGNDDGAGMPPDADTDTTNGVDRGDDDGVGGVAAKAVTLVGDDEPTTDGDTDADTNLTLDFGFFGYDVQIAKADDDLGATLAPGDTVTYTLTVTNNGIYTVTGATVVDTLPDGLTFVTAGSTTPASTGASGADTLLNYNLAPLAAGASTTLTVVATVDGAATTPLVNSATVSAPDDTDPANNTATSSTAVAPEIDLAITKVDDDLNQPLDPGDTVTYTLTVTNNGPSTATGVMVTDTLPAGLTFTPAGSDTPAGTSAGAGGTTVLTYNLGTLAATASTTVTIVATVDAAFSGGFTNEASVSGAENEPNLANNTSQASSNVDPEIDLDITKVDDDLNQPLFPGDTVTYTLGVTNLGPSTATGVTVTDTLPSGLTFNAAASTGGATQTAVTGGTQLVYGLGTLGATASTTVTIVATVDAGFTAGGLTNTATVSAIENEPNLANNTAQASSTVESGSIAGEVYVDANDNGVRDAGEVGIAGVLITLNRTDIGGQPPRTTLTNANGDYRFDGLAPGTYSVIETQNPFYEDGIDTSVDGIAGADVITSITLAPGQDSVANNFGEGSPTLTKRRFFASNL